MIFFLLFEENRLLRLFLLHFLEIDVLWDKQYIRFKHLRTLKIKKYVESLKKGLLTVLLRLVLCLLTQIILTYLHT